MGVATRNASAAGRMLSVNTPANAFTGPVR